MIIRISIKKKKLIEFGQNLSYFNNKHKDQNLSIHTIIILKMNYLVGNFLNIEIQIDNYLHLSIIKISFINLIIKIYYIFCLYKARNCY